MTSSSNDPEANRPEPARRPSLLQAATARPHEQAFSHVEEAAQVLSLSGTVLSNSASLAGIAKGAQTDLATAGAAVALIADSSKLLDIVGRWREMSQSPRLLVHAAAVAANAAGQILKIYADRQAADQGENVTELTTNLQISAFAITSASIVVMAASKPSEAYATHAARLRQQGAVTGGDLTQSPGQLSSAGSVRSQAAAAGNSTFRPEPTRPSAVHTATPRPSGPSRR